MYHSLIRNYTILTYVAQIGTLQITPLCSFVRSFVNHFTSKVFSREEAINQGNIIIIIISKIVLAFLLYTCMRAQCVGNMAIETKDGFVIATWVRSIGPCDGLMWHVTPWLDHSSPFFLVDYLSID